MPVITVKMGNDEKDALGKIMLGDSNGETKYADLVEFIEDLMHKSFYEGRMCGE